VLTAFRQWHVLIHGEQIERHLREPPMNEAQSNISPPAASLTCIKRCMCSAGRGAKAAEQATRFELVINRPPGLTASRFLRRCSPPPTR
jgi:hypothetical protein